MNKLIKLSSSVREALANHLPVVGLQSTIISHGMPYPANLACAVAIQDTVRKQGVVPATVAIFEGFIHVGLTAERINQLAEKGVQAAKVSRRDLPLILSSKGTGATTVSATMIACHLAGIEVFATGGIGGVHRGYEETLDLSADLRELGRTPVSVVSAGVKSILDIAKTLQYLETEGVPVVTYKNAEFPAFFSTLSGIMSPYTLQSVNQIARIINMRRKLQLSNGILIAVPNDSPADGNMIEQAIRIAIKQAADQKVKGAKMTPFLLSRVNELTQGRSLESNISLVQNNARVAAEISKSLCDIEKTEYPTRHHTASMPRCTSDQSNRIIVIGASAIDYQYKSIDGKPFQLYKSCESRCKVSFGGVARNIAEVCARLQRKPVLITALGEGSDSETLRQNISSLGINLRQIRGQYSAGKHISVMDEKNEEYLGVSEMSVNRLLRFDQIYEAYFREHRSENGGVVVIDANIDEESTGQLLKLVQFLSEERYRIIFECKGQKSRKILNGAIEHISLLKMNTREHSDIMSSLAPGKLSLFEQIGAGRRDNLEEETICSIVTDGEKDISVHLKNGRIHRIPTMKCPIIKKTTGAGDTFTGAFICSTTGHPKCPELKAIRVAAIASKLTLEADTKQSHISELLTPSNLQREVEAAQRTHPNWFHDH